MSLRKKILIVVESIDIEDSSGSKANVAIIENLRDLGHQLTVLHYTRKEIQLPRIKCVAIPERRNNLIFLLSRIQRKIQHGLNLNLAKFLEPVFGFSFTYFNDISSIVRLLRKEALDFDLYITLSKGASFRPHYALLQIPKMHNKWLAYVHDPYPFCYYPKPFDWKEPGFEKKIEFFKKVSVKCRWAAFPSKLLKEWMQGFFPGFAEKSIVIPHQLRLDIPEIKSRTVNFHLEKFTLLHAGFLLKQRPPVPLIKAFKSFLQNNPKAQQNSQLLLIGGAPDHEQEIIELQKELPQLYFSNGYVNYPEVITLQNSVSVNIILESDAEGSPFLPGKFPHCVAADKPILLLGPSKSESRRLLGEDYPYWAAVGEVDKIAEIIKDLYDQWLVQGNLILGRKDLEFYLSKDYLQQQMDLILKE